MTGERLVRWARRAAASFRAGRHALPLYAFALILPLVIDHASDIWQAVAPERFRDNALFRTSFWYQRLITLGFRKPRPRAVTLIPLSEDDVGRQVMADKCVQRRYVARLLSRLVQAQPAVIVLDKWYNPDSCGADPGATAALRQTLASAAATTRVVVGVKTFTYEELLNARPRVAQSLAGRGIRSGLFVRPTLFTFTDPSAPPQVISGLIRLDAETIRLPTTWEVYPSLEAAESGAPPKPVASLSLAAAEAYDPGLSTDLGRRLNSAHPFASFIEEQRFPSISAAALGCGPTVEACAGPVPAELAHHIAHRIIVIGERSPEDFHESPFGRITGYSLQANYIEALLDDRILRPVPTWIQLLAVLVWFAVVDTIFERQQDAERAFLAAGLVTVACIAANYYVLILQFGLFFSLWPGPVLALVTKYVARKGKAVADAIKARNA